jgi:hypothetical protein
MANCKSCAAQGVTVDHHTEALRRTLGKPDMTALAVAEVHALLALADAQTQPTQPG